MPILWISVWRRAGLMLDGVDVDVDRLEVFYFNCAAKLSAKRIGVGIATRHDES